jgi:hypothetical protein
VRAGGSQRQSISPRADRGPDRDPGCGGTWAWGAPWVCGRSTQGLPAAEALLRGREGPLAPRPDLSGRHRPRDVRVTYPLTPVGIRSRWGVRERAAEQPNAKQQRYQPWYSPSWHLPFPGGARGPGRPISSLNHQGNALNGDGRPPAPAGLAIPSTAARWAQTHVAARKWGCYHGPVPGSPAVNRWGQSSVARVATMARRLRAKATKLCKHSERRFHAMARRAHA